MHTLNHKILCNDINKGNLEMMFWYCLQEIDLVELDENVQRMAVLKTRPGDKVGWWQAGLVSCLYSISDRYPTFYWWWISCLYSIAGIYHACILLFTYIMFTLYCLQISCLHSIVYRYHAYILLFTDIMFTFYCLQISCLHSIGYRCHVYILQVTTTISI